MNQLFYLKIQILRGSSYEKKFANSCILGPILLAVLDILVYQSAQHGKFRKFSNNLPNIVQIKKGHFYAKIMCQLTYLGK